MKTNEIIEKRSLPLEIRMDDEGDSRSVKGYAVVYDTWTDIGNWYREKIAPGALRSALMNSDIRLLLNHDSNHLLARQKSGTLSVREDEKGLYFEATIPESREDVYEMVKRGDLDECSFAFRVSKDEWRYAYENDDLDVDERVIKEISIVPEITLATFGAYKTTSVDLRTYEEAKKAHEERVKSDESEKSKIENEARSRELELLTYIQ